MPEKIPDQPIVLGQRVRSVKVQRARDLRRTMTHAEWLLWPSLRDSQLGGLRWRRQQVIDGFIVDFYCHAAKVVVELDGAVHSKQAEYDAARDDVLAQRGLLILRFTNTAVETHMEGVLAQIHEICQKRISRNLSEHPPSTL